MNFSNYGYRSPTSRPPSTYSPTYASTPSNSRFLLPRFGYSSIPSYPRPRSSASKPNPDSYMEDSDTTGDNMRSMYEYPDDLDSPRNQFGSNNAEMDSMRNNFGSPDVPMSDSNYPPSGDSFYQNQDSFQSPNSSAFYSCSNTFSESPKFSPQVAASNQANYSNDFSHPYKSHNAMFGMNNGNASRFQNKSNRNFKRNSPGTSKEFFHKNINPINRKIKKKMAPKSEWRCSLCSLEFTSNIPFEMHLRGARHAKKMKSQNISQNLQQQVSKDIASVGNTFRCDLCNVIANSSLQFQTHLEGTKHKNKSLQLNQAKEKKEEPKTETSEVNGKSNGSTVRSLPADFGEPQPSKLAKYSCDICNVIVNSETQLQQHLTSKKHQAKVEGKPLQKKKQKKTEMKEPMEQDSEDTSEALAPAPEETKTVVGVKTLSSSFIAGETLQ